mmetsp:Transcript_641/g.1309  ORF Transcript_641/g.1309 Transcript_641/m.1309 type:complete len:246 (-) Transcript_641:130-867(-)
MTGEVHDQHLLLRHATDPPRQHATRLQQRGLPGHGARQGVGQAHHQTPGGLWGDVSRTKASASRGYHDIAGLRFTPSFHGGENDIFIVWDHLLLHKRRRQSPISLAEEFQHLYHCRSGLILIDPARRAVRRSQHRNLRGCGAGGGHCSRHGWRIAALSTDVGMSRRRLCSWQQLGLCPCVEVLARLEDCQLIFARFLLILFLPVCVRLTIDPLAGLFVLHWHSMNLRTCMIPLCHAVPAKSGQVH